MWFSVLQCIDVHWTLSRLSEAYQQEKWALLKCGKEVGKALGLRYDTMAIDTGVAASSTVMTLSQQFHRYVTAACGLFLSGKAEEIPKKCQVLIKTVHILTNDHQFSSFGQVESSTAFLFSLDLNVLIIV